MRLRTSSAGRNLTLRAVVGASALAIAAPLPDEVDDDALLDLRLAFLFLLFLLFLMPARRRARRPLGAGKRESIAAA